MKKVVLLRIDTITIDPELNPRVKLSGDAVERYAQGYRDGHDIPPVVVFDDGKTKWLADGFHRVQARLACDMTTVPCQVAKGTRSQAVLYAAGCNDRHGLPRSSADKRRAAELVLADPAYSDWTDQQVADAIGVSRTCVNYARRRLQGKAEYKSRKEAREGPAMALEGRRIHPDDIKAIADAVVARLGLALKGTS